MMLRVTQKSNDSLRARDSSRPADAGRDEVTSSPQNPVRPDHFPARTLCSRPNAAVAALRKVAGCTAPIESTTTPSVDRIGRYLSRTTTLPLARPVSTKARASFSAPNGNTRSTDPAG